MSIEPLAWWWWAHAAATWGMVGVIWMVQVVVYPGFARVPADGFCVWHQDYTRRMGRVVGPLMLMEMAGAVGWLLQQPGSIVAWAAGVALVAIWVGTVTVQVPQHQRLSAERDLGQMRRLVRGNWLRTILWTFRGGCVWWIAMG